MLTVLSASKDMRYAHAARTAVSRQLLAHATRTAYFI